MGIIRLDDGERELIRDALKLASETYDNEGDNAFDDGDDAAGEKFRFNASLLSRIAKLIDGASGVLIEG